MNHTIADVIQALSFYLYVLNLYTHTFHILVREQMEFRGKLMMIFNDHYRWTKGTLLNTKTHVASLGYSAVSFYEHLKLVRIVVACPF